ncbi:hypothetical protein MWU75_12580 [Ornithinimicrobium sp. F0845]|uniref:hypothetical protein n=1 Tax=Ornithinimicrobium sp. F0845 TaxID=2926412 RepID=UPI001FF118FB|nr:hypothetical protein [Ornithinimicrobium sp. F0845]MCK0112977.1 hypothetical protein [Ornithinimicrobium sp. F0845]
MNDILDWLSSYSGPVVFLILLGAGFLFVARTVVQRAVDAAIGARAERGRLQLGRRSAFEERVLTDRYVAFQDLFARIQKVTTTLNGIAHGQRPPDGFYRDLGSGRDIVLLTAVFEDLGTQEPILGRRLHSALDELAQAAIAFANSPDDLDRWETARQDLLVAAEQEFGLSRIRWEELRG